MNQALRSADASLAAAQRELAAVTERLAGAEAELEKKDELLKLITARALK